MGNIGPMEIIIVLVIALVVLGPKRLPEVGKSVGKGMREFKDGISGIVDHDDEPEVVAPVVAAPTQTTSVAAAQSVDAVPVVETVDATTTDTQVEADTQVRVG